jgi:hypothetical protein
VAATGFLPGILSFLCALSHLEGVAHRSINLFFQLQPPLSPGESVVQTSQQATQDQTTLDSQGCVTSRPCRGRCRLPGLEQRREYQLSEQHRLFPEIYTGFSFRECTHGFSQSQTQTFESQGCTKVLYRSRVGRTIQGPYAFRKSGRKWRRNPSHGSPWPFYSHASGLTLVTHGTACVPPARITLYVLPCQKLRINIKCTCLFGIILKYYSQA